MDLTGATVSALFRKSSGTIVTKTPTVVAPATAGIITLNFAASDVDTAGHSSLELKVTFNDGGIQHAEERFPYYVRAEYETPPLPL